MNKVSSKIYKKIWDKVNKKVSVRGREIVKKGLINYINSNMLHPISNKVYHEVITPVRGGIRKEFKKLNE